MVENGVKKRKRNSIERWGKHATVHLSQQLVMIENFLKLQKDEHRRNAALADEKARMHRLDKHEGLAKTGEAATIKGLVMAITCVRGGAPPKPDQIDSGIAAFEWATTQITELIQVDRQQREEHTRKPNTLLPQDVLHAVAQASQRLTQLLS